jgi:1-phosphatidylinositol-5-phosphate 4-kinase
VVEQHGKTLLPQFLGLYRVTVDVTETYLLVMRNVFGGRFKVHRKYDLKVCFFAFLFCGTKICIN